MPDSEAKTIMDADETARAIERIGGEVLARGPGPEGLALVGIETGGVPLARLVAAALERKGAGPIPFGTLDITLYRDDFSEIRELPLVGETRIDFPVEDYRIILIDDVLFTGRTVRAAINNIMDLGRPKRIELAVLVDRSGRELPIQPDYVGKTLGVADDEFIDVVYEKEEVVVFLKKKERRPDPALEER